jgi:hypothetical protein
MGVKGTDHDLRVAGAEFKIRIKERTKVTKWTLLAAAKTGNGQALKFDLPAICATPSG